MKAHCNGGTRSQRSRSLQLTIAFCCLLAPWLVGSAHATVPGRYDVLQPGRPLSRSLLQSGQTAVSVCNPTTGQLDNSAVAALASQLLGDSRLSMVDARFTGDCKQLAAGIFTAPNPLATELGGAIILSTGQATLAAGTNPNTTTLSTGLNLPGDPSLGGSTVDAAILEVDVSVGSFSSGSAQLALQYVLGSAEYASSSPQPDSYLIQMQLQFSARSSNVAILPGGTAMPGPGTRLVPPAAQLVLNSNKQMPTALQGYTKLAPTQGFPVRAGATYTIRLAIANVLTSNFDSVIMVPFSSLQLVTPGTAAAGGPYNQIAGEDVQLDGSRSSAATGSDISQYRWQLMSPSTTTVLLEVVSDFPVANISAPSVPGTYPINLTIWSVSGAVASSTSSLKVTSTTPPASPPPPVVASPPPANISISGSVTSSSPPPPPLPGNSGGLVDVVVQQDAFPPSPPPSSPPPSPPPQPPPPPPGVAAKPIAVLRIPNGPTVKARSDTVNTMVTLDASQSYDNVGSAMTAAWTIIQTKPTVKNIDLGWSSSGGGPLVFVFPFQPGEYLVTAEVRGLGGSATVQQLLVVAANRPPVATAGGPYLATVDVPFTVSADRSFDPDSDPLTYTWQLSTGPQVIGTYTGMTLTMAVHSTGQYTLQLQVDDGRGGVSATVTDISAYLGGNGGGVVPVPGPPPASTPAPSVPTPVPGTPSVPSTPSTSSPPAGGVTPANTPGVTPAATPAVTPAAPTPAAPAPSVPVAAPPGTGTTTQTDTAATGFLMGVLQALSDTPRMCLLTRGPDGIIQQWRLFLPSNYSASFWGACDSVGTLGTGTGTGTPSPSGSTLVTTAVIASPTTFVPSTGPATQVNLDATGSSTPTGRSISAFNWVVQRVADGAILGKLNGISSSLFLGTGAYNVTLTVVDSAGQAAVAARQFSVAATSSNTPSPAPPSSSDTGTKAVIAAPASFVAQADATGAVVQLSATGSKAQSGTSLVGYSWTVLRAPDQAVMMRWDQSSGTVKLPGGSYAVGLTVQDSVGGNNTAVKELMVGVGSSTGTRAVITWPPSAVAAAGDLTTVALDASGSAPPTGKNITMYIWAVVSQPDMQPAANGTGRLATVDLPRGNYTVGLLVVDSDGNTVTAKKNIMVADPPGSTPATSSNTGNTGSTGSTGSSSSSKPTIRTDLSFSGTAGGSFQITGVTAAAGGGTVTIRWSLMDVNTGKTTSGTGSTVSLKGISAGDYILLITATSSEGSTATGSAKVKVKASSTTTPAPSSSSSSGNRQAGPVFKAFPSISVPARSTLQMDAGLLSLLPSGATAKTYQWTFSPQGSSQASQTLYGRLAGFTSDAAATYGMTLAITDTTGKVYKASSTVRVTPPIGGAGTVDGRCGPWTAQQFENATLACSGVTIPGSGSSSSGPGYLWRLTRASDLAVVTSTKAAPGFGALNPGTYQVELYMSRSVPAAAVNAAFVLVSVLTVQKQAKLSLAVPTAGCVGAPLTLQAPKLLLPSGLRVSYSWAVARRDPAKPLPSPTPLTGVGNVFNFVPESGTYSISCTATISSSGSSSSSTVLVGSASLATSNCWRAACKNGLQVLAVDSSCTVPSMRAAALLVAPAPTGYRVAFAQGTVLSPGNRTVTVQAQPPTASNPTTTCQAAVVIKDTSPPRLQLRSSSGGCVAPANGNWHCFQPTALVIGSDNCRAGLAFSMTCTATTSSDKCRVVGGSQACVKADTQLADGAAVTFNMVMRDAAGNVSPTLAVPVVVHRAATQGCALPQLTRLP